MPWAAVHRRRCCRSRLSTAGGAAAPGRASSDDRDAGPLGRLLADGLEDLGRALVLEPVWPATRQELVEHHPHRVDVAGRRDRLPLDLLGAGILRREHPLAGPRQVGIGSPGEAVPPPGSGSISLAIPKPTSFGTPSAVTKMLLGFKSRWIIACWWANWTASQTWPKSLSRRGRPAAGCRNTRRSAGRRRTPSRSKAGLPRGDRHGC